MRSFLHIFLLNFIILRNYFWNFLLKNKFVKRSKSSFYICASSQNDDFHLRILILESDFLFELWIDGIARLDLLNLG